MTLSKFWSFATLSALAVMLLALPSSASADTYEIINLGNANSNSVFGIDAAGDVVIRGQTGCGGSFGSCYKTYDDGVLTSVSSTAPSLDFDDGTPCKPTAQATNGACNAGREAFGGDLGSTFGLFTGTDPLTDNIFGGSVDSIVLNSSGDIAWTDGMNECNYEAIDLSGSPVPEPNTLLLLATGVAGAAGMLRRRFVRG
jgi:PEP-CTERM motif